MGFSNLINILVSAKKIGEKLLEGIFSLVCDVYVTLARIYDLIFEIAQSNSIFTVFDDLFSKIYVLVGVFMLFRVTVSFLNMLIDPDKINDKQVGAGSILKRVFISVILLIVFMPNSYIFNKMDELQTALLADDGLISNFVDSITFDSIEIDDTSKTTSGVYNCYFLEEYALISHKYITGYHFKISSDKSILSSSARQIDNTTLIPYYYEFVQDTITYNDASFTFGFTNLELKAKKEYASGFTGCPTYFTLSFNTGILENKKKFLSQFPVYSTTEKFLVKLGKEFTEHPEGFSYSDLYGLAQSAADYYKKTNDTDVSDGSLSFSSAILKTFITNKNDADINSLTETLLYNSAGNKEVFDAYIDDDIGIDMLLSLIVGLAITVYLIFICVDVVVRGFKLSLLQAIAPIPIICHVDPKDKIFNQWLKMYLSTFADLFIKLLAIGIAMNIMDSVLDAINITKGWIKLFYVLGLLVFIKLFPAMISKLFGIDITGGSFKEIGKMLKTATRVGTAGVGAAIGLGVGAATGKGLGRITGALGGAARGLGSGYKGKVFGGAQSIASKNARINEAKANGLNFWDRSLAGAASMVGYSAKGRMDNDIKDKVDKQKMLDDWRGEKDKVEAMAEKTAGIADLKTAVATGRLGLDEYKKIRSDYIKHINSGNTSAFNLAGYGSYKDGTAISGTIAYDANNADKINHSIDNLKAKYNSNTSLQKELRVANGNRDVNMDDYSDYLDSESNATKQRNKYETDVIRVQSSDKYTKAQAFDDYSKQNE